VSWSFVNAGAREFSNNATPVTAALPTGWAQNNLLVIIAGSRGVTGTAGRSPNLPSGWSEAARYEDSDGSRGRIACFYKIAGASEANVSVAFAAGGATGSTNFAVMLAFSGNATSSPLGDVFADSNWAAAQNIGPITGGTLTIADQLLLVIAGRQQDMGTNGDSTVVSVLSGDSQTWAEAFETGSTTGQDAGYVVDYAFTTGTPTITDKTFTNSDAQTAAGCGFMVAFKPPAGLISGVAAGTGAATGALIGSGALSGAAAGVSTPAATLAGIGSLSGVATGVATAQSTGDLIAAASGAADGIATVGGTLIGAGALIGASTGEGAASGTLIGDGALSGASAGLGAASGVLDGAGSMIGSGAGVGAASATLEATGALTGISAGAGDASGTLTELAGGAISGEAAGSATAVATLTGIGALAGTLEGLALVVGVLTGVSPTAPSRGRLVNILQQQQRREDEEILLMD